MSLVCRSIAIVKPLTCGELVGAGTGGRDALARVLLLAFEKSRSICIIRQLLKTPHALGSQSLTRMKASKSEGVLGSM